MKTTIIKSKILNLMLGRSIKVILLALIFSVGVNKSIAQRIAPENEISMFNLSSERENKIERYSAKIGYGSAYLQWHVKDEREEGIFLVQRSQNMKDFKIISVKNDVSTQACITLLFSFIDKNPLPGISFYRIIKVYKDGSYYYSDIETIDNENQPELMESAERPFL